jgi:3',5'-cyclic-AMP phosphodiesterase
MKISRRSILQALGAAPLASSALASGAKKSMRIAYLSDIHLPNDPEITSRAAKALSMANKYDLVLFGGDNLMAIDRKTEPEIAAQINNWQSFIINLKRPYRSVIGNHDIEMWPTNDSTPNAGKQRAIELFGIKKRYWSEDFGGWRIIGLDTVQRNEQSFMGLVDDEQMVWLKNILQDKSKPTLVFGHMPLVTVTGLSAPSIKTAENRFIITTGTQVANARKVLELFAENGNVKIALSGHTHMQDRCDFKGTSYVCAGAVSGSWWNGEADGFGPAFVDIQLNSDGSFGHKMINY